jgi:uncharacterized protein YecE (DUF72 family)
MSATNKVQNQIMIGTSGYYYEDWKNVFYPSDLQKNNMLNYYSNHFNIVEINATYYTIPGTNTFASMVKRTPADFLFVLKTNRETTHRRIENKTAFSQLSESVKPLIEANKFVGYLAQFPYSFKNSETNRKYLIKTKEYAGEHTLFVEFRNDTWIKPQVIEFLKSIDISYVNVDQPQLKGLLPPQDIVTNDRGYIRFHGRNKNDWWDSQGSARYDYEYEEEELKEWLTNISNILRKTYKTYIFFNNHPNGQAIKNAKQMIEILKSKSLL